MKWNEFKQYIDKKLKEKEIQNPNIDRIELNENDLDIPDFTVYVDNVFNEISIIGRMYK